MSSDGELAERLAASGLYAVLAESSPQLRRGMVWCKTCGERQKVDVAHCLRHGWPEHCGQTMVIDAPEERK